jgi:aryl sulfotransferase
MLNKEVKPIWLASFPKSGNTWTRLFLSALLQEKELDINNMATDGIISARNVIDSTLGINSAEIPEDSFLKYRSELYHKWAENHLKKEYLLTKVHDGCILKGHILFPPSITRGVIYILRNPFDMVASIANHNGITIKKAVKSLCNNEYTIANKKTNLNSQISQHLGTWSQHVEGWTNIHRNNLFLMKYEDMLNDGINTFSAAVRYLELDYTKEQIEKAIEEVSFKNVQKKETESTFKETPTKAERFFRNGKMGGWRNEITEDQAKYIIDCNYETLLKYNYIEKDGTILV